jgi:integrase
MNKSTNNEKTRVGLRVTILRRGQKRIFVADYHHDGRHRRKSLKTTVKREAMRKAMELEYELENGIPVHKTAEPAKEVTTVPITKAIADFINYLKTEGRRRKTLTKYQGIVRTFAEYAAGQGVDQIEAVDLPLVDKYRAFRKPTLSARSMSNEGGALKRFLAWCLKRGLVRQNPLADETYKRPQAKSRGGPTLEQINTILKAATPARRPIIAVAAFAGVRIGEIARLRVDDVDFEDNWLHIVSRPSLETKSGQSWKVPLHSRLRTILERVPHGKEGWFFTAEPSRKFPDGDHHINPKRVNEDLIKLLKKLDMPAGRVAGFTFHSLRSSFKTICIHAGVPREVVDVWQNHAPDRAASHVYYKLSDEESQRFMRIVPFGDES